MELRCYVVVVVVKGGRVLMARVKVDAAFFTKRKGDKRLRLWWPFRLYVEGLKETR